MSELTKRYESMIQAIAALHAGDPELASYLHNLRMKRARVIMISNLTER